MDATILADTREKDDYVYQFEEFPAKIAREALVIGDYTVRGYENEFAVERKSLNDLARCCGADRERFKSQVERGAALDEFAIVVESRRIDAEEGNYRSDIHPNCVLGTADSWEEAYGVRFYWCIDQHYSEMKTYSLLEDWYQMAR